MLGWALRLLLLFLLIRALILLLRGVLRGAVPVAHPPSQPRARDPLSRGTLVQDPVCGTYVLQDRALSLRTRSGETAFFCSEGCRSAYMMRRRPRHGEPGTAAGT